MYAILKDFAGPVATVIASVAASYVVYHFSRAQLRATDMRLVLDLFDRRWEVVQELRVAIGEIVRDGIVGNEPYRQYLRATQRAALLFGTDVTDYLETLRLAMVRHVAQQGQLRSDDDAVRVRAADAEADAFTVITGFYEKFDLLIAPYMQMHQKLPT
jgi:hypothetical protein